MENAYRNYNTLQLVEILLKAAGFKVALLEDIGHQFLMRFGIVFASGDTQQKAIYFSKN